MSIREAGSLDDAFEAFFEAHCLSTVRLAFLLVGRREVAEELAQDALAVVHRRWAELDNPGGFLRTTLVNMARSHQRRAILERRVLGTIVPPPPLDDDDRAVWDEVRALRPRDREVIVLRFHEDLSLEQIASVLDLPVNTVKTRQRRALERLRRRMS